MADIIIIGGGIAGLLTARELQAAGAQVTVIEKGLVGQESSWAGGGILSPLYPWRYPDAVNELARWSQHYYPQLAQALFSETGVDPQWLKSGLLILDSDETAAAQAWLRRFPATVMQTPAEETLRIEPAIENLPEASLWLPEVAQIRNPHLVKALTLSLLLRGVRILEHTPLEKILIRQNKVTGVMAGNNKYDTARVVIAAGAWSGQVAKEIGVTLPIEPVRGQMLCFHGSPNLFSRILLQRGYYLIPRSDGIVLAGSTIEHKGFDKTTTQEAREEIYRAAMSLIPTLRNYPIIKQWAGLRPSSPSGIPFIGEHPDIEGLFFNSGHFRNGFVLTPASARLLGDIINRRAPFLSLEPYKIPGLKN